MDFPASHKSPFAEPQEAQGSHEIAKRLPVSRASVGWMLDRARKVGLVPFNLNADYLNSFEVSSGQAAD